MLDLSVYVETTVISYLTSRPSRDVVVAGRQQITREWWDAHLASFRPYVSPSVMEEISRGDVEAASQRLRVVESFEILELTPEIPGVADTYFSQLQLPERARADSYHLAFAAWHGVDFLVTWNCAHLASGFVRRRIHEVNTRLGISTPTICTPEELMEIPDVQRPHR